VRPPYALVVGGAGFVGANLVDRLARDGRRVVVLDALRRPGVEDNAVWLRGRHGDALDVVVGDVRDRDLVRRLVAGAEVVFHLAAQVAVTTSMADPLDDFDVNARGTVLLLEALRASPAPVLFTSTNKVYGELGALPLTQRGDRWEPEDEATAQRGVDEQQPLDFHSPYGCSKGAADQYVLDYARTFGLPATVFRMSCIYGPRQFGTEDQGWLAHFAIRALRGEPIALYGDGRQVRDLLYVDDLVDAMLAAWGAIDRVAGRAFNIGGGPARSRSLREALREIERECGVAPVVEHGPWRAADQRWYVSDTRAFGELTGWRPTTSVQDGVSRLCAWLRAR
jgi:CDP-paratose 2-epimerase